MKKQTHILSQNAAAKLAGVSRQAFTKLQNTRSFFTKTGKVDTDHPDWKSYLREKEAKKNRELQKTEIRDSANNENDFDFQNFKPTTIQEEKTYAEILQKKVQLMQDLDTLVEKPIVVSAFSELAKNVQSNFVDMGRRVSPRISAKLGLPGTEKIIEKEINEEVKKGIINLIASVKIAIGKL